MFIDYSVYDCNVKITPCDAAICFEFVFFFIYICLLCLSYIYMIMYIVCSAVGTYFKF